MRLLCCRLHLAIPFLFIKKKKEKALDGGASRWKFAIIKLGYQNLRQILAEFEAHGVKVSDLKGRKQILRRQIPNSTYQVQAKPDI